jgi:hypothetical protein
MRLTYLIFCAVLAVALVGANTINADFAKEPYAALPPDPINAKQMRQDAKELPVQQSDAI